MHGEVVSLIESTTVPSVLESIDLSLLYIADCQSRADDKVQVVFDKDYPVVFARDGDEFAYFLDTLRARGRFDPVPQRASLGSGYHSEFRLTPEGWTEVDRLRRLQPDSNQAFVAMWFKDDLKLAREVGFEPALNATGFKPYRVDMDEHDEDINDRILAGIRRSGLLIADFTGQRAGVYYEAGFARGLGIYVISTCKQDEADDLHFDTEHINHIFWSDPKGLYHKLVNRIAANFPDRGVQ